MTFLGSWRWMLSALASALVCFFACSWWYGIQLKAAEDAKSKAIAEERQYCQKQTTTLKGQIDAYQKRKNATCDHAAVLQRRMYETATCQQLPTQAASGNRGHELAKLDRQTLSELIELARKCDDNTAAAMTLDKAWVSP